MANALDLSSIDSIKDFALAFKAYSNSKLAISMFASELDKRCKKANLNITAVSLHPGYIKTEIMKEDHVSSALMVLFSLFAKSVEQGAATTLFACIAPDLDKHGGAYLQDCAYSQAAQVANDDSVIQKLWKYSEEKTGMSFDALLNANK